MCINSMIFLAVAGLFCLAVQAVGVTPSNDEMSKVRQWTNWHMKEGSEAYPFSFEYDGKGSNLLLDQWKSKSSIKMLDKSRTEQTVTYTDPKTGLEVRCVTILYHDFPTVEWTLYFKNTGTKDTPIISGIQPLDVRFERGEKGEFLLHHFKGGPAEQSDYQPFEDTLGPKSDKRITTSNGRPTNSDMPYFNIEWGGEGAIVVLSWQGQWAANFIRDDGKGLRVRAGQELTHFKLHPGEEVRTPMIVLQFYKGDWIRAQNVWRRWMVAHNLPRPGGKLPKAQLTPCSSHQFGEMINANEENQKLFIDKYIERGLKPDYWWMDAGWYPNDGSWSNTGTWEVDKKRFPNGLRAVSDYAHAKGIKTIVWFEPERVTPGTWLHENHPEWLLKTPADFPDTWVRDHDWRLLNMGNPEARKWLTDHVDKLINEQGIDLYRQDYNIDPLLFWRAADEKDRQGITEINYSIGYLAYWDELRKRHPGMLIDSCASGGRRNDLETMRRAVPLLRSDYIFEPIGQQGHTYGLSFWIPYYGTGIRDTDAYTFRSAMGSDIIGCWDIRDDKLDYPSLRKLVGEWRSVSDNYMGDYYPLTPYSLENNVWMAWQFDRPEAGEGVVQAFRRAECTEKSAIYKLYGLDPKAHYTVTNVDGGKPNDMLGRELMENGLPVEITIQPGSAVITYKRVK